ncbi:hypothetical protein [Brevibacterium marinum]|uniref:Uncharacterized protein n=1 Tax=Brevibacterium marinum TaxID=418643 RepID=A0A846RXI0_9MICO|nr:hypothetical protein [Brevibacterium marinum]NJC55810.1 hypothetical protein [Brevibacterium marinum]
MSDATRPEPRPQGRWFAVDVRRIMRLPDRLKPLWPHELMPHADDVGPAPTVDESADGASAGPKASAGDTAAGEGPGAGTAIGETLMLEESTGTESTRGLDVLTAWLTGFAAELDLTRSRMTIVVSSGEETAHLEVCLGDDIASAILVLRGVGFEEFEGYELLRRLRPQDLAEAVEELCSLIENDCVLTLSCLNEVGAAGLEFLHRVDGTWVRPTLERDGDTITVGAGQDLGSGAVATLLAATLTRLWTTATQPTRRSATNGGQP